MDGYLTKPIDPTKLFAMVEQRPAGVDLTPAASAATPIVFDSDGLLKRLAGDAVLMSELISLFIEEGPRQIAAVEAAVRAQDAKALRAAAHGLMGAASSLAANGLFEAARRLERIGAEQQMDRADGAWQMLSAEGAKVLDELRRFDPSTTGGLAA